MDVTRKDRLKLLKDYQESEDYSNLLNSPTDLAIRTAFMRGWHSAEQVKVEYAGHLRIHISGKACVPREMFNQKPEGKLWSKEVESYLAPIIIEDLEENLKNDNYDVEFQETIEVQSDIDFYAITKA